MVRVSGCRQIGMHSGNQILQSQLRRIADLPADGAGRGQAGAARQAMNWHPEAERGAALGALPMKADRLRSLAFSVFLGIAVIQSGDWGNAGRVRAAEEATADVLAAHLRLQGHRCEHVQSAQRDTQRSKPDEAVWIVTCESASYRVQLVPHMAARVERIEPDDNAAK